MDSHMTIRRPRGNGLGPAIPWITIWLVACGGGSEATSVDEDDEETVTVATARTDVEMELPEDAHLVITDGDGNETLNCPGDTQLIGESALEQWCERNEVRHGPYMAWNADGSKRTFGTFNRGRRDGRWTMWFANGNVESVGQYQLARRQGSWTWWHENGERDMKGDYLNDRRAGVWTTWHPNGQRSEEGVYLNDMKEGEWRFWNNEGNLIRIELWKSHELIDFEDISAEVPDETQGEAPAPNKAKR